MAIQNEEKHITVAVYDGEIVLKSPRFADYLDMYISEDVEEEEVAAPTTTSSRARFLELSAKLVVSWSYEEPVTKENIAALDAKASVVLFKAISELFGTAADDAAGKA